MRTLSERRDVIPLVAEVFQEFGYEGASLEYSFDNLAKVVGEFVNALKLKRYAMYVFDYGAPTGLRLAMAHPEMRASTAFDRLQAVVMA